MLELHLKVILAAKYQPMFLFKQSQRFIQENVKEENSASQLSGSEVPISLIYN